MRWFFLIFGLGIISIAVWSLVMMTAPSDTPERVQFEVAKGQGVNAVSRNLKKQGLIRSSFIFETIMWYEKLEGRIIAGTYSLSKDHDVFQIVDILTSGVDRVKGRVTLIEGWDLKEYTTYLGAHGFDADAFISMASDIDTWSTSYPFLASIPAKRTLEGYLFPDTYTVDDEKKPEQLIRKMLDNFRNKLTPSMLDDIRKSGRTLDEVIILASIVENEVPHIEDRKMVADIFTRRLKERIGLQSDATINYITRSGRDRSTADDLATDSPYNTYKYRGLPPGPIGNPGIDAIKAVIYPTANSYFYFLTGKDGAVHYGKTYAEHQKNRQLYL